MIDTHHHLWRYTARDFPWISAAMAPVLGRDFLLEQLRTLAAGSGVTGLVAVQARQAVEETDWLLEIAAAAPDLLGVVGWVPLAAPAVRAELERLAEHPKLRGVRHILHDEPDPEYMLRDDFSRGVSHLRELGLVYDILVFERQLPQTIAFVDRHPEQVFVVDHLAKPRIRAGMLSPWRERIRELARRPNVSCKLSGMVTEADWGGWMPADLRPYVDVVLDAFGPRRLMFGSDWPVLTLAASYSDWVRTVRALTAALSEDERAWIETRTARAVYGL